MWKDLARRLITALERHPEHQNQTAMVRTGDILYELDLFRSLSSGKLHLGPAYPYSPEEEEKDYDSEQVAPSITPQPDIEEREKEAEPIEEEIVDVKQTSFSKMYKHEE